MDLKASKSRFFVTPRHFRNRLFWQLQENYYYLFCKLYQGISLEMLIRCPIPWPHVLTVSVSKAQSRLIRCSSQYVGIRMYSEIKFLKFFNMHHELITRDPNSNPKIILMMSIKHKHIAYKWGISNVIPSIYIRIIR